MHNLHGVRENIAAIRQLRIQITTAHDNYFTLSNQLAIILLEIEQQHGITTTFYTTGPKRFIADWLRRRIYQLLCRNDYVRSLVSDEHSQTIPNQYVLDQWLSDIDNWPNTSHDRMRAIDEVTMTAKRSLSQDLVNIETQVVRLRRGIDNIEGRGRTFPGLELLERHADADSGGGEMSGAHRRTDRTFAGTSGGDA
ncbi:hypothetical protein B0T21DRAFT_350924 [Apiosordaria backusii]|uniref:Uncharacterized protein n=1 Tax=Apiosordaria backusii TaxID=314023 RepID=A0AA40AXK8_9PEZI|nr:hypothetical protein B0T21DRAFT_350924 [Apiosordaria backusii]